MLFSKIKKTDQTSLPTAHKIREKAVHSSLRTPLKAQRAITAFFSGVLSFTRIYLQGTNGPTGNKPVKRMHDRKIVSGDENNRLEASICLPEEGVT